VTIAISNSSQSIKNDLPDGWSLSDLGVVVDILDGQRVPVNATEREKRKGDIPYYGATGQVGWIDDYLFDEELILLGEDGAPFLEPTKQKAYIIRGKSWVNNHAHVLRARNGIPNGYIKYYLDIVTYHKFVSGTTRLKLNQSAMRRIPVPIAPSNEQKLIVSEIEKQFSRLDEAVASLKRVKTNLKRYKAAVLKAAVEGKLTEEWRKQHPDVEPAENLLKRILAERKKKWEAEHPIKKYKEPIPPDTSNLPKLPKGWVWVQLQNVFDVITDGDHQPPPQTNEGIPFLVIGNVRTGKLDFSNTRFVSKAYYENIVEDRIPRRGDILYTVVGSYGIPVLVDTDKTFCVQRHIAIFKPSNLADKKYLYHILQSNIVFAQATKCATGTAQKTVPLSGLRAILIPFPSLKEQKNIVEEVERRLSVTEEIEDAVKINLNRADRLRQSILKIAFSGKLVPQDPCEDSASKLLERIKNKAYVI